MLPVTLEPSTAEMTGGVMNADNRRPEVSISFWSTRDRLDNARLSQQQINGGLELTRAWTRRLASVPSYAAAYEVLPL